MSESLFPHVLSVLGGGHLEGLNAYGAEDSHEANFRQRGTFLRLDLLRTKAKSHYSCPLASPRPDNLSLYFAVSMDFSKWICFQYVLSFVFQKRVFPTLCFQYVLSFVPSVALAKLRNIKST